MQTSNVLLKKSRRSCKIRSLRFLVDETCCLLIKNENNYKNLYILFKVIVYAKSTGFIRDVGCIRLSRTGDRVVAFSLAFSLPEMRGYR